MKPRWRITGTLTTTSPLHIGMGDTIEHPLIVGRDKDPCDIQAIVKGHDGRPCIPGTAIKGVLRGWAEAMVPSHQRTIDRIFGPRDISEKGSTAGWAEFCTAFAVHPSAAELTSFGSFVPYWNADSWTGILSHVCIDRSTGAAEQGKLFYEEFVPEGMRFNVEIDASRLDEKEIGLLLKILTVATSHSTHPCQFGANGADGWGRMKWTAAQVLQTDKVEVLAANQVGFDCCTQTAVVSDDYKVDVALLPYITIEMRLSFGGPFLVNDNSRTHKAEGDGKPHFIPLRRADGSIWLPSSSFRGSLREHMEFLVRSLDASATGDPNKALGNGPIERVFGQTSQSSVLTIEEFAEETESRCRPEDERFRRQDFVAIDRWTGGAADGAKFDARYASRPELKTRLTLNVDSLEPLDLALFVRSISDVCRGMLTFGWGASKGYGIPTGSIHSVKAYRIPANWNLPQILFEPEETRSWLATVLTPFAAAHPIQQQAPTNVQRAQRDLPLDAPTKERPLSEAKRQGFLIWQGIGKDRKPILEVGGGKNPYKLIKSGVIHPDLVSTEEERIEVDYILSKAGNAPEKIWRRGTVWQIATPKSVNTSRSGPSDEWFAHPYYFLHLKDRTDKSFIGELGDNAPDPEIHRRFLPDRYSGTLRVRMTIKTPLILCDDEDKTTRDGNHLTYPIRLDEGKPMLAASSVRGMLRAAYEAITNSRFGVFPGQLARVLKPANSHGRRLGFRLPAKAGLGSIPARIVKSTLSPTGLAAELLCGTTALNPTGNVGANDPVPAAWLCRYQTWAPRGSAAIRHGDQIWAYLTPWTYHRLRNGRVTEFKFWNVEEIRTGSACPVGAPSNATTRQSWANANPDSWDRPDWHRGYACISNRNMQGKHDERVFFSVNSVNLVSLNEEHVERWHQLIEDYQIQHERELDQGLLRPPVLNPPNVFSRHITSSPPAIAINERTLKDGDLCYAELRQTAGNWAISALYPVMISRKLFSKSPLEVLPLKLRPAAKFDEFSPADRVFGWVSQNDDSVSGSDKPAFRSPVTVGNVTCVTDASDAISPCGRALAILGQPKPQQGRFYLGQSDGTAQKSGLSKEESGYKDGNRIRGPKVYPHHQRGIVDEIAFSSDHSNQNRSIESFVKEGTVFEFDLSIKNLTAFELGGLLWLLQMPPEHYLRLGLAKSLGFGSVRLDVLDSKSCVANGQAWIAALARADESPPPGSLDGLRDDFNNVMDAAHPTLLKSFLKVANGYGDVCVCYPRMKDQIPGSGETYRWFVENEKSGGLPLPDILPAKPTNENGPLLPILAPHS